MKKLTLTALLILTFSTVLFAGDTNSPPCAESSSPIPLSLIVGLVTIAIKP